MLFFMIFFSFSYLCCFASLQALCYAAHAGQLGTVQLLLSCQAQPDLACYDGQLAEDLAFSNEHAEVRMLTFVNMSCDQSVYAVYAVCGSNRSGFPCAFINGELT